jgi:hypothetical protein
MFLVLFLKRTTFEQYRYPLVLFNILTVTGSDPGVSGLSRTKHKKGSWEDRLGFGITDDQGGWRN